MQHSSQCRARLEKALEGTEKGRERLELAKERLDRYAAKIGEDLIARDEEDKPDAAAEGEMRVPTNLDEPVSAPGHARAAADTEEPRREHRDAADVPCQAPVASDNAENADGAPVHGGDRDREPDTESEGDDSMFDGGAFGGRAPETPGAYSPTSPMSMDVLTDVSVAKEDTSDMAPILSMLAADDELCNALMSIDNEIISIVNQLGGNSRRYRRAERTPSEALGF